MVFRRGLPRGWLSSPRTARTRSRAPARAAPPPSARRHVIPHDVTLRVFAKGRWVGRGVVEVYAAEMPHHDAAYYRRCLAAGRLRCAPRRANLPRRRLKRALADPPGGGENRENGAGEGGVLRHGDVVLHTVHRHEIPVSAGADGVTPVRLLAVRIRPADGGWIAAEKPTGLPTHAGGRYAYNSALAMLEYVLAPRRLAAWLRGRDPLLQSLVSTELLGEAEKAALWEYYRPGDRKMTEKEGEDIDEEADTVPLEKLPRPCHRLDRVTSGILLLGVSEAATSRVGRALMNKSKHAEEFVLAQTEGSPGGKPPFPAEETNTERLLLHRVVEEPHGVRKRYLARVSGRFSPDGSAPGGDVNTHIFSPGVLRVDQDTMKRVNHNILHPLPPGGGKGEENTKLTRILRDMQQDGILFVNPVMASKGSAEANALELAASPPLVMRAPVLQTPQTAMTLCQQLNFLPAEPIRTGTGLERSPDRIKKNDASRANEDPAKRSASILQCIPFTGRLHQIRVHLSKWGFPIEGDTIYGAPIANNRVLKPPKLTNNGFATDDTRSASKEEGEEEISKADGEAVKLRKKASSSYVYYDPNELPKSYLEYIKESSTYKNMGCEKNEQEKGMEEDFCYECAGKLPITTLSESVNASAIRLHAWRYELSEDILFDPDYHSEDENINKDDNDVVGALKIRKSERSYDNLPRSGANERVNVPWESKFVERVGKQIIFSSPIPEWALE